jgi:hypothetical protein
MYDLTTSQDITLMCMCARLHMRARSSVGEEKLYMGVYLKP